MSFTMDCPLCGKTLEVDDDMAGQTATCPECGGEIVLDPDDAARHAREDRSVSRALAEQRTDEVKVSTLRAAGIAFAPSTMPPITWSWAFDTVAKLTIAIVAIDGFVWLLIWIVCYMFGLADSSSSYRQQLPFR